MQTKPGSIATHPWKSKDPDAGIPDRKGMLLSDQIHKFCEQQPGLLISKGYRKEHLRPAAYTLTIGEAYADSEGQRRTLTSENPSFEMPPNSIVFVSAAELLDLPYYIVARFNLRVEWVYKGILLGTGPQVEPGFKGQLSCPLYNLTSQPHTIALGDEFATIDFERTSNFIEDEVSSISDKLEPCDKLWLYEGLT
jgi:deoxycytidine triphosphate deaminase